MALARVTAAEALLHIQDSLALESEEDFSSSDESGEDSEEERLYFEKRIDPKEDFCNRNVENIPPPPRRQRRRPSLQPPAYSSSRDDALTLQQQGGFWALSSGQSGRPQLANVGPSSSQPQRFSDQLAYDFPAGQGHKSLSPPKNLGGGLTSSSQGTSGATYSSPSWYNPQAVSQSRPGPLVQLKARLFTSQGAPVTSSSVRPASDFAQQTGSPPLTVPPQGAPWWPFRRFPHGFQDAPSQVPSAPSGHHGGLVSRFEQYSPASQKVSAQHDSSVKG
ncbi:hypothetical protein MHYP_G00188280 [Metynnis hypsauchen]